MRMPIESAPQERIWMAFPTGGYTLGESPAAAHVARSAWAEVAHAVVGFEPVTVVVDPGDSELARDYLGPEIDLVFAPLNDAWMRDIGPTFVHDDDGRVAAVDWCFNGWGRQSWAEWDKDSRIGGKVAHWAGVPRVASGLVNEGGGIQVDGEGTVLVTETVQRDPLRNPGLTRQAVEDELRRTIGASKVIWLPRGLTRDAEKYGTRGHVDLVAAIPEPGKLLVHSQQNTEHPDHSVSRELIAQLAATPDAKGRHWNIAEVPAPETLADSGGWVDYSYINHLVVNGGVIACTFNDPMDDKALGILAEAYPGRTVKGVDARQLFARGGGIHCITQQQPQPHSATHSQTEVCS